MRSELSMQIIATPVSAKIAAHMFARPIRPRTITSSFTKSAMMMFCTAMLLVLLAMPIY